MTGKLDNLDLFGLALYEKHLGKEFALNFKIGDNIFEIDLNDYFKQDFNQYSLCERFIFENCYGKVLDIGSGAGSYHQFINGEVVGLDNSLNIHKIYRDRNIEHLNADVYKFSSKKKFNTIIILGNSLGLGGNTLRTYKLVSKIKGLLAKNGQILICQKNIEREIEEFIIEITYKNLREKLKWASFGREFTSKIFMNLGFKVDFPFTDQNVYVLRAEIIR